MDEPSCTLTWYLLLFLVLPCGAKQYSVFPPRILAAKERRKICIYQAPSMLTVLTTLHVASFNQHSDPLRQVLVS